jgi:hypothetical protein
MDNGPSEGMSEWRLGVRNDPETLRNSQNCGGFVTWLSPGVHSPWSMVYCPCIAMRCVAFPRRQVRGVDKGPLPAIGSGPETETGPVQPGLRLSDGVTGRARGYARAPTDTLDGLAGTLALQRTCWTCSRVRSRSRGAVRGRNGRPGPGPWSVLKRVAGPARS